MRFFRPFEAVLIAGLAVAAGILFWLMPHGDKHQLAQGQQTRAQPTAEPAAPEPKQASLERTPPRKPAPGRPQKPAPIKVKKPAPEKKPERDPNRLMDIWFSRYRGSSKIGWGHLIGTRLADGYRIQEEYQSRSGSALTGKTYNSQFSFSAVMDREFVVKSMLLISTEAGRVTRLDVTRSGQTYTFRTLLEGRTSIKRYTASKPVIGSNDLLFQRLFRQGKLRKGFSLTFREFDTSVPKSFERTLTVLSEGKLDSHGKRRGVVITFGTLTAKLNSQGLVQELTAGGTRMVIEPESVARELPAQAAIFRDRLRINVALPNYALVDEVTMRFTVRGYKGQPIFKSNEYQQVQPTKGDPTRYTLRLRPRRFKQSKFPKLGFPVAKLKKFLEPDSIRQSDAPEVKRKALQIIGKERNSLAVVRKLARWVHVNLRKQYTAVGNQTAIATLDKMSGDCSEHALLFDSLARSLRIPVKQCSGYVFLGNFGGPHAWSQVWLGQEWIHVDAVLNSIGSDPRYILFWKQNATDTYDRSTWIRRGALSTHRVSSRISQFKFNKKQISVAAAGSLASKKARRFDNPLIGFSLDLPPGWTVSNYRSVGRLTLSHRGGLQITVRTFDSHPQLVLKSRNSAETTKLKQGIDGKPTWRLGGWRPLYVVEHGSGSLLLQLRRRPRGAVDRAATRALLAAIKLKRGDKPAK